MESARLFQGTYQNPNHNDFHSIKREYCIELIWLEALVKKPNLVVPAPVRNLQGDRVVLDTDAVDVNIEQLSSD